METPNQYEVVQTPDARIIKRPAKGMYIEDFVKYSIVVVRRRAFAEIRDSFKPVQRKILYDMWELGATPGNPAKKSARVVGDTMGKYHPHGDSSIYDAMAPIAQFWRCKLPLITPNSEFGNIMGTRPPAMRYTEVRLSQFAMDCIFNSLNMTKNACNWKDNFDLTMKEPEYLPVNIPLLLINGSFGIGAAVSNSEIPPHNPIEVIEAARTLIKNPNADIVLVPDYCVPLDIVDTDWKTISETGYGKFEVRGHIETVEEGGHYVIHVRSLPENTNSVRVKDKLLDMVEAKQLPMVKRIDDASNNAKGVDLIVTLKQGADPKYVEEILYTKAGVSSKENINFFVIDDVNPLRMSYKEYLLKFLDIQASTRFRIYCNKFKDVRTRCHKLETYVLVGKSGELDNIIKMVRKNKSISQNEIREYLIKKLNITDLQADFILTTDIMHLSAGYIKKYEEELKGLMEKQEYYRTAITDGGATILKEIDEQLLEMEKKYGTPRVCRVVPKEDSVSIPKGTFKIVLTNNNLIRKIPDSDNVTVVRKDNPKFIVRIDNSENLLLFDTNGRVYKLPVHKIPLTEKSFPGTDIRILCKNLTSNVIAMYSEEVIKRCVKGPKQYMVVVTKDNVIKKLDMEDFLNVNLSGLQYSKMKPGDSVAGVVIAPEELDVVIYSKQRALRCPMSEIPLLKRNASGSKAMDTNTEIEGISVLYPDTDKVVVVTENGKVNLFSITGLPSHKRARAGNNVIKLGNGDSIVAIYGVKDADRLKFVTAEGVSEVEISTLKVKSGVAAGDRVVATPPVVRCDLIYGQS